MPFRFEVDQKQRTIFSTFSGDVSLDEIRDYMRAIQADAAYDSTYARLVDFRDVTKLQSAAEARAASEIVRRSADFRPESKRAWVTRPGAPYGMARMIELLSSSDRADVGVFTSIGDARAWLGLDPDPSDES